MAESSDQPEHRVEDYMSSLNSPTTNRRNAGVLIRRMSDDFNKRKFPHIIKEHKKRTQTESETRWRVATHAIVFIRRLRGSNASSSS